MYPRQPTLTPTILGKTYMPPVKTLLYEKCLVVFRFTDSLPCGAKRFSWEVITPTKVKFSGADFIVPLNAKPAQAVHILVESICRHPDDYPQLLETYTPSQVEWALSGECENLLDILTHYERTLPQ